MSVVRLIHVKVPQDQKDEAERLWNEDCGPVMREVPGCISEKLLKCMDEPGEYISFSEWESEKAIEDYRKSDAHKKIQQHSRNLQGAKAVVKRYGVIE